MPGATRGIIFAQFIYGMSTETGNFKTITIRQFAESIKNSVRYIYEAVGKPGEGTMLTVIKDWANYIYENRNRITDFNQLFVSSLDVLNKSLYSYKIKTGRAEKSKCR